MPQRALCTGSRSPSTTPESRLPAINRLEGFLPGGSNLYCRVLVPVSVKDTYKLAWVCTVEATRNMMGRPSNAPDTPKDEVYLDGNPCQCLSYFVYF